jgi:hypothetical protein
VQPILKRGVVTISIGVICLLAVAATGGAGPCGGLIALVGFLVCAVGFGMTVVGLWRVLSKSSNGHNQSREVH